MTLDSMKVGDRVVITRVRPVDDCCLRLMILGLVEGAEIECTGINPGRSSLALDVYGCTLAVPRDSVKNFKVTLLSRKV
jgi:Fe2+ transport system protein FeoA